MEGKANRAHKLNKKERPSNGVKQLKLFQLIPNTAHSRRGADIVCSHAKLSLADLRTWLPPSRLSLRLLPGSQQPPRAASGMPAPQPTLRARFAARCSAGAQPECPATTHRARPCSRLGFLPISNWKTAEECYFSPLFSSFSKLGLPAPRAAPCPAMWAPRAHRDEAAGAGLPRRRPPELLLSKLEHQPRSYWGRTQTKRVKKHKAGNRNDVSSPSVRQVLITAASS